MGSPNCGALLVKGERSFDAVLQPLPYYSSSREIYFGSTQSPMGTIACLLHLHALGKKGVRELRKNNLDHATFLSNKLESRGFTILNPNRKAPFVSIGLTSRRNAEQAQNALRAHYEVSLLNLKTKEVPIYGLRIVIMSKPHINPITLLQLTDALQKLKEKHPEWFISEG